MQGGAGAFLFAEGRLQDALLVSLGGIIGALTRYYLGLAISQRLGTAFPYGTLFINVTGCFVLGLVTALALSRVTVMPPELRLLVGVGFCGAYTTFSSFGVETIVLIRSQALLEASVYVLGSVVAGVAATALGWWCARLIP